MIDEQDCCTVVSICPFPITKTVPHTNPGSFYIPLSKNEEVKYIRVGQATTQVYLDAERGYQPREIFSSELARAIVDDHINSTINVIRGKAEPGLFWVRGEYDDFGIISNFDKELQQAKLRQKNWYIELVKQADTDWAKYKSPRTISDIQRIAAGKLQLRKEWDVERIVGEIANCPACRRTVHPEAVICECGFILSIEKYKTLKDNFVTK